MDNGICIPNSTFPSGDVLYDFVDEPLVDIANMKESRIRISMRHNIENIEGAPSRCLLRRSAAEKLLKALRSLPLGYGFRIYDAWRPNSVQKILYDKYYTELKNKYGNELDEDAIKEMTGLYISYPKLDPELAADHTTGGAIDLAITSMGLELPMGSDYGELCDRSHSAYYEICNLDNAARDNRRLLYECMTKAGFINLPTEWWHYSYGDAAWARTTGRPVIYKGILSEKGGRIDEWYC